jgi:hypothetical protein
MLRGTLVWTVLGIAVVLPTAAAAVSPLLAWRDWVYVAAGFSGILGLVLLLFQPLLAGRFLPGLSALRQRMLHRIVGGALVAAVVVHVAALWITSPPDMVDALLFRAPTLFSVWGVLAMWTLFAVALVAAFRRRLRIRPRAWRLLHTSLAVLTVVGTIAHVLPIEGTMEIVTKAALCMMIALVTLKIVMDLRPRLFRPRVPELSDRG